MKYIFIVILLLLVTIIASNTKYQEPLMQFDNIVIVPITTFPKKNDITITPVSKPKPK
jgi:hypothetical protein